MPVLGLRGTGSWGADERPKSYRETILYLFPNGDAPLTALTSKIQQESVRDPEFKIFLKGLPVRRALVNGAQADDDTTIEVKNNLAKIFRNGDVILNERTLEQLWVTADPTGTTAITVARGKGGTTAAAMNDGDGLVVIGRAYAEGASVPSAVSFDPTVVTNYLQIFRTPINITRTAKATQLRWGNAMKELKREALQMHAIDMEMAFLFGKPEEDLTGSQPKRTTGGLAHFVTTNVFDAGGALSESEWDSFMKDIFKKGSTEKLYLCGNTQLMVLSQLAKAKGRMNLEPSSEGAYGMKLVQYITPHGILYLKGHPLLSQNPTFASWGFVVDLKYLRYRYLEGSDTKYLTNRQSPGDDVQTDEWLTECGLEVQFEDAHGIIKNVTSFAP